MYTFNRQQTDSKQYWLVKALSKTEHIHCRSRNMGSCIQWQQRNVFFQLWLNWM